MHINGESTKRTVVKTVTWRVFATAVTVASVYAITGSVGPAIGAGIADNVLKTATYYMHERLWTHSKYGLNNHSRVVPNA